jgi:hypothetical protein
VELVLLKRKQISIFNHFEEEDFYPDELWNRRISRFDSSRARYHLVLGFRLSIRCRLVAAWWMANKQKLFLQHCIS